LGLELYPEMFFIEASAKALPFADNSFDAGVELALLGGVDGTIPSSTEARPETCVLKAVFRPYTYTICSNDCQTLQVAKAFWSMSLIGTSHSSELNRTYGEPY
jgi:hypothetical protein